MLPRTIKEARKHIEKGEKVIIACCFDKELYALQEEFGDECVIYNGKLSRKQKDDAENNITHNIDNQSYIIDPIDIENDGMKKEPNEDENWSEGFEREHFPGLPVHSEFMKLDSSVENLDNNLKGLFYLNY